MKILIYSLGLPPFRRGGLTNYTVDLAEQLDIDGDNVTFLYPGKIPWRDNGKVGFREVNSKYRFSCYEMINPLPVSLTFGNSVDVTKFYASRSKREIRNFIRKISPDVVHIHTLMGLPIEFLEVLKEEKIKSVFTTHDYYGLCPKMLTSSPLEALKSSQCTYDCMLCSVGPSFNKLRLMQSHFYQSFKESKIIKYVRSKQREKTSDVTKTFYFSDEQVRERYLLRKYYLKIFDLIDYFHFNSTVSKNIFKKHLPNVKGTVIPLTEKGLKRKLNNNEHTQITIGFLGGISEKKGFNLFVDAINELNQRQLKFAVLCAGSMTSNSFFDKKNVHNVGIIPRKKMNKFYKEIDVLVVPSRCHETFGLVVLEAISQSVPVICSDMVGAKDLLENSLIFHSENELVKKLNDVIKFSKVRERMHQITNSLKVNLNFSEHVDKIKNNFYQN